MLFTNPINKFIIPHYLNPEKYTVHKNIHYPINMFTIPTIVIRTGSDWPVRPVGPGTKPEGSTHAALKIYEPTPRNRSRRNRSSLSLPLDLKLKGDGDGRQAALEDVFSDGRGSHVRQLRQIRSQSRVSASLHLPQKD
uniref:Uncharacterized protein n=1 Tax=Kalanchoe fedtschenkoi TaxID=63787 RepID=A0A7N1A859_KALFE